MLKQQWSSERGGCPRRTSCLSCSRLTNRVSPLPAGHSALLPVVCQRFETLGAVCVTELCAKRLTHQLQSQQDLIAGRGNTTTHPFFFFSVPALITSQQSFFVCMATAVRWLRHLSYTQCACLCVCNLCNPRR